MAGEQNELEYNDGIKRELDDGTGDKLDRRVLVEKVECFEGVSQKLFIQMAI